jgi:hypothetical protein
MWLACLFLLAKLVQPARLEVVLRLIRVGRDREPCGCCRGGFVDKLEELAGRYRLFDGEVIGVAGDHMWECKCGYEKGCRVS